MRTAPSPVSRAARPLGDDDIERVVAIDRAHAGRSRRHFFAKRFAAAKAHPDDFIHVGVSRGGALRGFATARIHRGEFGGSEAVAVLDAIGVAVENQDIGVGQALMQELADAMRRMGVGRLQTQVDWRSHDLLRFFDAAAFELAPRLALERSVAEPLAEASEEV
jgi:ribosomal protein S18 acetylase RimI-like enzyme